MDASTASTGTESFFQIWVRALTKPNESTYAAIASSPRAKASTAFLWIFLCTFAPAFVSVLVSGGPDLATVGTGGGGHWGSGRRLGRIARQFPVHHALRSRGRASWASSSAWHSCSGLPGCSGAKGTLINSRTRWARSRAPGLLVSAVLTLPSVIPYVGICVGDLERALQHLPDRAGGHGDQGGAQVRLGRLRSALSCIPGLAIALVACCIAFVIASVFGLAHGRCLQHDQPEPGAIGRRPWGPVDLSLNKELPPTRREF